MRTIAPSCPEPDTGPKYWKSLGELTDSPEFLQWLEREFPSGASEFSDPVSRRHFMKIMSASFLLAGFGLSGCRPPPQRILPFSKLPETNPNYVHGLAQFYATAMPGRGSAAPLLVKSNDGRPTKVEGNPQHPDSNGGTDHYAQASILSLYDPDRAMRVTRNGSAVPREAALDYLAELSRQAQASGGTGLSLLLEQSNSPSRTRLQQLIRQRFPNARWHVYEPVDLSIHRQGASIAFGAPVTPYYVLDKAKILVSLDCDFLGTEEDTAIHCRRFARGRKIEKPGDPINRLYAAEGLMTLTGSHADHRLRVPPSLILSVAARLALEILDRTGQPAAAIRSLQELARPIARQSRQERWIVECAKDLLRNRGACVVMAGHRQPLVAHVLAQAINTSLGNIGQTVILREAPPAQAGTLGELAQALNAGQVQTLVVLGGNPVYNAPADLNWAATQRKAKTIVRLGDYEDETFSVSDWHLPRAHYLESWGDARTADGTLVPIQPLIAPLFDGLTDLELLARIGGLEKTNPYDIVRETFLSLVGGVEDDWERFLHDGFRSNSAAPPVNAQLDWRALAQLASASSPAPAPSKERLELVFQRDYSVDDGRYNNNGWLQELPDPVTKMTWENVVLVSFQTARELGLYFEDDEDLKLMVPVVRVEAGGRSIEGPLWIQPGMADHVVGIALGYGRRTTGRVGRNSGYNAYLLRTWREPNMAVGARVQSVGRFHRLASTQSHWSLEGRPIVREANLKQYLHDPKFAKKMDLEHPPSTEPLYPNPLDSLKSKGLHQWGMSIDLNLCVGCNACVLACQSENNVPIVGKEMVSRSREMHWLRIDRYYSGDIADPQVVNQPMLCQHCETAPCENVCPVNATVHDEEGLNLMIYNRCVGTRYCSNNCPYKVRRFNYFDYNKRPREKLLYGPLAKRPTEELDVVRLVANPDVTVRMRGVMEKCTFCIQRIEQAKIAQKVRAGASPDIRLKEDQGTIPKMACQQACPAEAIVFGDISDPNSRVSQLKQQERDYTVLEFLSTKPRLTYLARVRNPNENMPDYHEIPLTWREKGHPLEHGGGPGARGHGDEGSAPARGHSEPAKKGAH